MSESAVEAENVCPGCKAAVSRNATRCVVCGTFVAIAASNVSSNDAEPKRLERPSRLEDRRWFILCLMLFVALFLAFPLLWRSPSFSRREKAFWTFAVLVETVVLFGVFGWVMWWSVDRIREALRS